MSRPRLGASEKARRVEEGIERNTYWRSLSTRDKIASLLTRRGNSARQLRLLTVGEPTKK